VFSAGIQAQWFRVLGILEGGACRDCDWGARGAGRAIFSCRMAEYLPQTGFHFGASASIKRASECSAARLAHLSGGQGVVGSNPATPTTFLKIASDVGQIRDASRVATHLRRGVMQNILCRSACFALAALQK
jgi:hypothetical protein